MMTPTALSPVLIANTLWIKDTQMIHVVAQDNAANMLETQATPLAKVGKDKYYVLDGKAWAIRQGQVFRSEDDTETQCIIDLCKELERHRLVMGQVACECPNCGTPIPDEATPGDECVNCGHVFWLPTPDDDELFPQPMPNGYDPSPKTKPWTKP